MKKNLLLILSLSILSFYSCNNDNLDGIPDEQKPELRTFVFKYKGETYSSTYSMINDSTFSLHDKRVEEILENLQNKPNLATLYHGEDNFEYFDNRQEYLDSKKINDVDPLIKAASTRTTSAYYGRVDVTCEFYEHDNYKGWMYQTLTTGNVGKYNDQISSFVLRKKIDFMGSHTPVGAIVTLFEHENFRGASLIFEIEYEHIPVICPYIGVYKLGSKNWNDKITSIEVKVEENFEYNGQVYKGWVTKY